MVSKLLNGLGSLMIGKVSKGSLLFLCCLMMAWSTITIAQPTGSLPPTITSFAPTSGSVGTSVTITGSNFDATPANNIVFFGATQAAITAVTPTTLTVTVPTGATYQPITVLVNGLTSYSSVPFVVTFPGGGTIDINSFDTKVDFASGSGPYGIAIGDLDGDGKTDLAVANYFSNTVSVFRNTSTNTGIISYAPKVDYTTGTNPSSVSIGDLDGDGKTDLVVTNEGSSTVSVFRNTNTVSGTISFAIKVDFAVILYPQLVSIGDLNKDGKADLVVSNGGSPFVSVFKNTSTGTGSISFTAKVDYPAGSNTVSVFIGDLDGDGKEDIVSGNSGSISVFRNTSTIAGTISFDLKVDFTVGVAPYSVSIGDLDSDGKADIVVANSVSHTISIFRNTSTVGNISMAAKVDYTTGLRPTLVSIGDLDGDGKVDLAVSNDNSSTVSVFRNTSSGASSISFATKIDFSAASQPLSVAIGDLDGDGKADLATANYSGNSVSVIRNAISSLNTTANFTSFSLAEQTGVATIIGAGTIAVEVAYGTDVTTLVPSFTLSTGATSAIGATPQVSGTTSNNFTNPVIYTVTALDGVTTQSWTVTVTIAPNTATNITAFSLTEQTGTATIGAGTIAFEVANGTDVTTLVPTFTLSTGATTTVGTVPQVSGTTANNFTNPVVYTVTALDGVTTQSWTVTVTIGNVVPTDIAISNSFITEGQAIGTAVGTLTTTDADTGDSHSYSLAVGTGDTDNTSFSITGGQLLSAEAFVASVKSSYNIRVQTDDGNGGIFEKQFIISINTTGNAVPTDIALSNSFITEGQASGTAVGTLTTTDADTGDSHSYSLAAGTGDTDNGSFTITGDQLLSAEAFVASVKLSYNIRVQTNDGNGGIFEKELIITIDPINLVLSLPSVIDVTLGSDITVDVLNNSLFNVVSFYYRGISEGPTANFQSDKNVSNTGTSYAVTMTGNEDPLGVEFKFVADLVTGGSVETETSFVNINYTGDGLTIPSDRILFSETDDTAYRVISVPLTLGSQNSNTVFDELGQNSVDWRLYSFTAANSSTGGDFQEQTTSGTSIKLGVGYFILGKTNTTITTGAGETAEVTPITPVIIQIKQGWNLIGNPYNFTIDWADVLAANTAVTNINQLGTQLKVWLGSYANTQNHLLSFQGGFVFSSEAMSIKVPVVRNKSLTGNGGRLEGGRIEGTEDFPTWMVNLSLQNNTGIATELKLGMHEKAQFGYDKYDQVAIPSLTTVASMEVKHPEFFVPSFTSDIIPVTPYFEWEFGLNNYDVGTHYTISWEIQENQSTDKTRILYDVYNQRRVNMSEITSYSFMAGNDQSFILYYGNEDKIAENIIPSHLGLGNAYPNPGKHEVTIPFTIPKVSSEVSVHVAIYNLQGKLVKTLTSSKYTSGFYQLKWGRTNNNGVKIPSGVYIVSMKTDVLYNTTKKIILE